MNVCVFHNGSPKGAIVFLHGFMGDAGDWEPVVESLGNRKSTRHGFGFAWAW